MDNRLDIPELRVLQQPACGADRPLNGKRPPRRSPKSNGQTLRFWSQTAFALLCLWIGVEFHLWYGAHAGFGGAAIPRPPGVEGFLPISALMSLWYWALSGEVHMVHPAGLFILAAVVAVSLVLKKSFCSWLCPVGTISENVGALGRRIFGRVVTPWRWLDIPLRGVKYLALGFLVYVLAGMTREDLALFLSSPYNRVADVKMYLFFADISRTALIVIGVLLILSTIIRNFWCRYLCPYGALLGIVGLLSPLRITRNAVSCIDCAKCAKACPSAIPVDRLPRVLSDECTSCMACVDACPVADTLRMAPSRRSRRSLRSAHVAAIVAAVFLGVTGAAMLTGHWRSEVSEAEYGRRIRDIDNPIYQHNQGQAPQEAPPQQQH